MKKRCTEQDLRALVDQAGAIFEEAALTALPGALPPHWQDEGVQVEYESCGGQVRCVLRRCVPLDGKLWELKLAAPLAGTALPEDSMSARERELCREDLNRDPETGVYNRRFCETELGEMLDTWAAQRRGAAFALVELASVADGAPVPPQLACFVANQWKKRFDRPGAEIVCRVSDRLFLILCADRTRAGLDAALREAYAAMPHECALCTGMLRRQPFALRMACAGAEEVRGKNWAALYELCTARLRAAK